jgi:hypothetical protein
MASVVSVLAFQGLHLLAGVMAAVLINHLTEVVEVLAGVVGNTIVVMALEEQVLPGRVIAVAVVVAPL